MASFSKHRKMDFVVIGAGQAAKVAAHQSGNNSGVIHSGIYYKPGSERSENCKRGYRYLLDYVKQRGIKHEVCGKLIVATEKDEMEELEKIYQRGLEHEMKSLAMLNKSQATQIEPYAKIFRAISVPQAGIADYSTMASSLAEDIQDLNGTIKFNSEVIEIEKSQHWKISTSTETVEAEYLINCAGLYSDKIAKLCNIDLKSQIIPFRGEYYNLIPSKKYLVNHLIYPVPNPAFPFLGVHFTRMTSGHIEAGPNAVLAFKREGYSRWDIDRRELLETLGFQGFQALAKQHWKTGIGELHRSFSKTAFVKALQKLIPEIKKSDLVRGGSGVRAMAVDQAGNILDDYLLNIENDACHVLNAPSPAATSCLSIGEWVVNKIISGA